ncbi:cytochrome b/b6 domain-containing protein [Roseovarius nanhaiticus]|uniref:cytochrome b/b6 domain-containing protein n=1 Tax=Roseovarius nanhaiticus TaxID=573024 RepID=UPI002490B311|nr:cytochrome b/b6 domain-containing protein [Roseovarius nanhaiticus]
MQVEVSEETAPRPDVPDRGVMVWDPLVRLIHWGVALAVIVNAAIVSHDSALHLWAGYMMLVLVGVRLVWGVIGTPFARFAAFPPSPSRAIEHLRAMRRHEMDVHLSHNPLGALMVYNIWGTLLILALSGYMMGTLRFFGVAWVADLHEAAYIWLLVSIALHVGGVVFDTWRTGVPLMQAMIHGRKRIPPDKVI